MKKAFPFILAAALLLFVVLAQLYYPKPVNWIKTFEKKDKNPYGDFILYSFLEDLFPAKKIEVQDRTIYEVLDYYDYTKEESTVEITENRDTIEESKNSTLVADSSDTTQMKEDGNSIVNEELQNSKIIPDLPNQYDASFLSRLKNYIILNSSFSPGETDANALFDFVQKGSCVFISAEEMSGPLADSLKIKTGIGFYEREFDKDDIKSGPKKDSIYLMLLNKNLQSYGKKYWYRDGTVTGYFSSFDTSKTTVLGKNSLGQACYIKMRIGEGIFLISTTPLAFTNYNMMLANNSEFISSSFSYLPVYDTYWDEHYKNFRETDSNSLRFIESQPPLFWAFYLALCSTVVYILFEAKRRQRIIPVMAPLRNTTVEFVTTIGRMYFQNGNNKDIASKKIYYFLEYIRAKFYVGTNSFDNGFSDTIAKRAGMDKIKVEQLFALIQHLQKSSSVSSKDLMELNKRLEEFRKISNG